MSRPVTLFTGQWADLPLEKLAPLAKKMGYDGVELACWGDHFEVDKAVADPGYAKARRELLEGNGLGCWALGAHLLGQAVAEAHDAADAGDLQGAGDDGGVAGGRALFQQQTSQLVARVLEQIGGAEVAGDEDGVVGHLADQSDELSSECIGVGHGVLQVRRIQSDARFSAISAH